MILKNGLCKIYYKYNFVVDKYKYNYIILFMVLLIVKIASLNNNINHN